MVELPQVDGSSTMLRLVEREKRYPNYTLIGYYTGFAIRFAA